MSQKDNISAAREELRSLYDDSYVETSRKASVKEMIQEYRRCGGNATKACRNLGVSYKVFLRMKKSNKEAFEEVREMLKSKDREFVYNKLMEMVAAGNTAAVIFAAKSICGLREVQEMKIESGSIDVNEALKEIKKELNESGDQQEISEISGQ